MSKTRHTNRWGMVALLGVILGVGMLFAGCGKAPRDEGKPGTKVEIKDPVKEAIAEKSSEKPAERIEAKAAAKEAAPEKTPLMAERHPPFLHLAMDDNAASPAVLDASNSQNEITFLDPNGDPNTGRHSAPGVAGTALTFDGVDDSIIVPAAQAGHIFAAGTDFSVACWWRSDSDPFPDGYREILSNYTGGNGGIILYQRGSEDGAYKRIYLNFYVAGNGRPILVPFVDVPENTGRWHHYVFQREGSTLRAWRDGRLRGSYTGPVVSGDMGSEAGFRINSPRAGAEGAFDDLRIYPRALSVSEIRRLASTEPVDADLFWLAERLRDLEADPAPSATEIERIERALDKEIEAQKNYPKQIGKNVELLAFRYSFVENDEYEMAFAFRTDARLVKDYHIYVRGQVDPSHVNRIPKVKGGNLLLQKWGFMPDPLTSAWTPGDVIVVRNWVRAAEVPYNMYVSLLYFHPEEGWQEMIPEFVPLGWHASL